MEKMKIEDSTTNKYPTGKIQTGIYVTDEEAELFKIFLKYSHIWSQIFGKDNRNTEITLFFNNDNELRIAKELKTFKN